MYEELIQRLREAGETLDAMADFIVFPNLGMLANLMNEAANAIEELDMKLHGANAAIAGMQREIERMVIDSVNSKPKWIPVTERLPNPTFAREWYLVALESGCVTTLGFERETMQWHITGSPVAYWMPIPKPPKEET